jgi:hypothetical protein
MAFCFIKYNHMTKYLNPNNLLQNTTLIEHFTVPCAILKGCQAFASKRDHCKIKGLATFQDGAGNCKMTDLLDLSVYRTNSLLDPD